MLADDNAVLADDDALGISLDLDRPADSARADRVLVVIEAHEAGLRYRSLRRPEPVKPAADPHELGTLGLEYLPDRLVGQLRVLVRLGVKDALVEQPGVQLRIVRHPQPRHEQALADVADLVLDLSLLPARRRRAGGRLDQVMPAHLQEAAVEPAILADEHCLDRRLHVVVDAARAGPLEEIKGAGVRVEHHLLALARIGPHERHPAVAQPDMSHLDLRRHPVQHDDLMAPVELVGLARGKTQRNKSRCRRRPVRRPPYSSVAANRVIAALVAEPAQLFEHPNQRQPLACRLLLVGQQQPIEPVLPRTNPRPRLLPPLIAKRRRFRTDHLAHDFARQAKLATDRLDRLLLKKIGAPYLRHRLHNQHPSPGPHVPHGSHCEPAVPGVPFGRRSPPKRGPYSTPIYTYAGWGETPRRGLRSQRVTSAGPRSRRRRRKPGAALALRGEGGGRADGQGGESQKGAEACAGQFPYCSRIAPIKAKRRHRGALSISRNRYRVVAAIRSTILRTEPAK